MCGNLDQLTKSLEDLEREGGADEGAGFSISPYGWAFRYDLDRIAETVINLLHARASEAEVTKIVELYNCVMSIRWTVRADDISVARQLGAGVDAAPSPLES